VAEAKLPLGNPHDPDLVTAARKAEAQLASGVVRPDLRRQVEQVLADLAMLEQLETIRLSQAAVKDNDFDLAASDLLYARAFRDYGIDVEALEVAEAAARIRRRAIGLHLAAALDDWAIIRRDWTTAGRAKPGNVSWKRLFQVARAADPDRWRQALRDVLENIPVRSERLNQVVRSIPSEDLSPITYALIGRFHGHLEALLAVDLLRKAQQRYPADFWINENLGKLLRDHGELAPFEEAVGYHRVAVALRPDSPGVHYNLGLLLLTHQQYDQAIAPLQEATRLKKDYYRAHLNLGNALGKMGRVHDAIAAYQKAIEFNPNWPLAHYNLGNALRDKGRLDEAIKEYRQAIRLNPDYPEALCNLGHALRDKGQFTEALTHLRRGHELGSQRPDWRYPSAEWVANVHLKFGNTLHEKGRWDDAIAEYQEALRLKPDYAEAFNNLGLVLRNKGRTEEAINSYRTAIRLKKGLSEAHFNLGYALHNQGREVEAMDSYRTAVRLGTKHAWAYLKLGTFVASKGQMEEAIPLFQAAIRLARGPAGLGDADLAVAHEYLGAALGMRGRWEEALPALREAVRLRPQSARAQANLGQGLSVTGRAEEADAAFREALRLAPNDVVVINNYAWFLVTCPDGKFRDARRAVELAGKAVAATPKDGNRWQTLGVARYRVGQWAEAVTALEKAMRLRAGGDANEWFFLAMAHRQLGHPDEAAEYYHKAVRWVEKHQPKNKELRRFRAEAAALLGIADDPKAPGKDKPVPQP
jgi:superkiller protein 3